MKAKQACLFLRHAPHTKFKAFEKGLKRIGFETSDRAIPDEENILVMWNRYFRHEKVAKEYERVGGRVIVAENGWIGKIDECKPIALCLGHHNGAGKWPIGNEDRWSKCGVELKSWREDGDYVLLLPQRGFGEDGIKMPHGWLGEMLKNISRATKRRVMVRCHPGTEKPKDPNFDSCWAAVTWASGAGIKALANGIPVFYGMKGWIGEEAAKEGLEIERPFLGDRLPMFQRLAWAQWSPIEIETGEPFERLLGI